MLLNTVMVKEQKHPPPVETAPQEPDFKALLSDIAKNRNKKSFITLFEHFAPRIKSFLMKAGLNPEIADELSQETMLTIWDKASSYDPAQAAPSTWIFTIARNKRIDHLRKNIRHNYADDSKLDLIEDDTPSPIENTAYSEESESIAGALETLPEEQADLIKKSFFEDKSHAEIAEETGIPLGTIKSRIRLALKSLSNKTGVKQLWN